MEMNAYAGLSIILIWLLLFVWVGLACKNINPLNEIKVFLKKQSTSGRIVFLLFFLVMTIYGGTKPTDGSSTNDVNNVSGSTNMSANASLGQLHTGQIDSSSNSPLSDNVANSSEQLDIPSSFTNEDFERGFVLTRVATDEVFDFSAPANAVVCEDWRAFGAATDWMYIAMTNWAFNVGTNYIDSLRVFSFGKVEPYVFEEEAGAATNYWFAPFVAKLGIVPEANEELLLESSKPSQVWYQITPQDSLIITWQNALLDRDVNKPVSFQVEFNPDGLFTYRYDFSRLDTSSITNIIAGASFAGNTWATNTLSSSVTSMTFYQLTEDDFVYLDPDGDGIVTIVELFLYGTNPQRADSDYDGISDYKEIYVYGTNPNNAHSLSEEYYDGIAVALGDLNPHSYQGGSTNTVLQHIFYSGSANGYITLPTSNEEFGVLKITVSGEGTGKLVVDNDVVPLIGSPRTRSGNSSNTLLLKVGKGKMKSLWFEKPEGLEVALDSDDFFIGDLPTWYYPHGWIAFPHTEATHPCIHEIADKNITVSLVHGEEFDDLTATWEGGQVVTVTNVPPVSAELYAGFSRDQTAYVSYVVNHPKQLNKTIPTFEQEFRYCPPIEVNDDDNDDDDDDDDDDEEDYDCYCSSSNNCECTDEYCSCGYFGCVNMSCRLPNTNDDETPDTYSYLLVNAYPLEKTLYLYRDNIDTIKLDVPGGTPKKCCPCEEHWASNYVAQVYHSRKISVVDNDGDYFRIAYEPCSVNVSGLSPSKEFHDASVLFVTNAVPYKQVNYTVLGVTFETPNNYAPAHVYKELSSSFGFPATVCTNIETATSIFIRTDVLLTNGIVKVSLQNATGDIALWLPEWSDKDGNSYPAEMLLQSDVVNERYYSIKKWRNILKRFGDSSRLELKIISSEECSADVNIDFISSNGARYVHDYASIRISTVFPPFRVDITRDGRITEDDINATLEGKVYRYWINDDVNKDDALMATSTNFWPNASDYYVNGKYDLINFFPIAVSLNKFSRKWGQNVKYVIRSAYPSTESFKFCFVNLDCNNIYFYQTNNVMTIPIHDYPSQNLSDANLIGTTSYGYEMPNEVIPSISTNTVGIICEGANPYDYLKIDIEKNNAILYSYRVPINLKPVKNMYSWYNFRYLSGDNSGRVSKVNNNPEEEYTKNLIFVHGANLSTEDAEKWGDAIYKRLWHSGLKANFYNVDWRSDIGSPVNYQENVSNSFVVAERIAPHIKAISNDKETVVMAHSLGNMVVSSMIQDHGLEVSKYFMLNSAVPVEAYDNNEVHRTQKLVHVEWEDYPTNSWSAYWHTLFTDNINDDRKQLKWTDRFQNVNDNIVNFYSSGDEVLNLYIDNDITIFTGISDSFAQYAWHKQELFKGINVPGGTDWSGWSMKRMLGEVLFTPLDVENMSTEKLKHTTVFKCQPESMNTNVIDRLTVDAHLAQGIPTLTPPIGIINLNDENIKSIDLNSDENIIGIEPPNGWPTRGSFRNRWLHSDIYEVAYYFNFKFYEKILDEGGLQ